MKNLYLIFATATLLLFSSNIKAQCTGFDVQIQVSTDTACAGDPLQFNAFCTNTNATIDWQIYDNSYINNTYSIYTSSLAQSYSGRYIAYANYGSCYASDTVYVNVGAYPPSPNINSNSPVCEGQTLTITMVPQVNHSWLQYAYFDQNNNKIGSTSTINIPNVTAVGGTGYLCYIYDTVGCGSGTYFYAHVFPTPAKPNAASNSPVCNAGNLQLSTPYIDPSYNYVWTGPGGAKYYTKDVTINGPVAPGKHKYIVKADFNGCESEADTIDVEVGLPTTPKVAISANPGFNVGPYVPVTYTANTLDTGTTTTYQWYKNLVAIPGATNKTVTLINETDIKAGEALTVRINSNPICAVTNTADSPPQTIVINLGVDDINDNEIALYPNPVHDVLFVTGLERNAPVSITTISGKEIAVPVTTDGDRIRIETAQLPAGTYLLRSNGRAASFVKEK